MDEKRECTAAFWCGLLSLVLYGDLGKGEVYAKLREISQKEVVFPDGEKKKPSYSTLKRKWKTYKEGGFNALARKGRNDLGKPRAVLPEVIQTAVQAKREVPERSALMINQILQEVHGQTVACSTLYRHLREAGATRLKLGISTQKLRKRWTCEHTHEMWMGDFEYGPYVMLEDGRVVRSYLSAFIDVCSRRVLSALYYVNQNVDVLVDTLMRAFDVHGTPLKLYLDNGKVYHSTPLQNMCYRLGIQLLYRPVRDPACGGLIERFIQTVQGQFETEVNAGTTLTLPRLNESFSAWMNVVYDQTVNSDTRQTPLQRYQERLLAIRPVDGEAVRESFRLQEWRTVDKTFSDIRLHSLFYQVDPRLRGDRVLVRYDLRGPLEEVDLYDRLDRYLGKGVLHQREQGQPLPAEAARPARQFDLLDMLVKKHKEQVARQVEGLDYSVAREPRGWPFSSFVASLAELLGLPGGVSAFTPEDIALLQHAHAHLPKLTRTLLKRVVAQCERPTVAAVLYHLQNNQE